MVRGAFVCVCFFSVTTNNRASLSDLIFHTYTFQCIMYGEEQLSYNDVTLGAIYLFLFLSFFVVVGVFVISV